MPVSYFFAQPINKPNIKVHIGDTTYDSVAEASRKLKVNENLLSKHIRSKGEWKGQPARLEKPKRIYDTKSLKKPLRKV